jgi:hypothetical protein
MELIGIYLVGCILLMVAGVAKVVRPADTARALSASAPIPLSLAVTRRLVRFGAAGEAVLGAVALAVPRSGLAWLVALSYAAFAVFVAYARSRGGAIASCGCFGTPDTPATLLHAFIDLTLAGSAVAVALSNPSGSIVSVTAGPSGHRMALLVVTALCAWLTFLVLAVLPQVQAARRLTAISFRSESSGPSREVRVVRSES